MRGGGRIQNLELSDLKKYPELEIISHQTMRPMHFSFGFGSGVQKESSISNIYVLRPTVAGTYEFAPAVAKVDGKVYRSGPLTSGRPSRGRRRERARTLRRRPAPPWTQSFRAHGTTNARSFGRSSSRTRSTSDNR